MWALCANAADRIEELELALREARAIAVFEQRRPSDLHMTAFSIIEKKANEALCDQTSVMQLLPTWRV